MMIPIPKEIADHEMLPILMRFMQHEKFLKLEELASKLGDLEFFSSRDTIDLTWRGGEEYVAFFIGSDNTIFPTIGITGQKVEVPLFGNCYEFENFEWDLVIFSISLMLGMRDLRDENREIKKIVLSRDEEIENLQRTISQSDVYTRIGQHINVIA